MDNVVLEELKGSHVYKENPLVSMLKTSTVTSTQYYPICADYYSLTITKRTRIVGGMHSCVNHNNGLIIIGKKFNFQIHRKETLFQKYYHSVRSDKNLIADFLIEQLLLVITSTN